MSAILEPPRPRRAGAGRKSDQRIMFRVASLWGFSRHGVSFPVSDTECVESGPFYSYLDPDADPDSNIGVVDFERGELRVRYGFQVACPRIFDLVAENGLDPALLTPLRILNTEECALNPELSGWSAKGVTETLPGGNPLIGIGGG